MRNETRKTTHEKKLHHIAVEQGCIDKNDADHTFAIKK